MHYVMRSRNIIISLILVLVLASCSTSAPTVKPPVSDGEIYYVAKVDISASDSQKAIESKYGAKAVFFNTEAGFAVLGFTKEAGELTSLTTTGNQDAYGIPEVTAQGYETWAGGYETWAGGYEAWAGGYEAWAGGYEAWAGGYDAWAGGLPLNSTVGDNMHVWDRINLAEGQLRAPNLGEGVVVAVIDTGIDAIHPELSGRMASLSTWKDYVDNDNNPYDAGNTNNHGHGHGTAVSSLVLKVAPNAQIMPIRVLDTDGSGDTDDVVSAIAWAIDHGADIINLSLGTNDYDPVLKSMVDWATSQGVFIVSSVGNSNNQNITYPAGHRSSFNKVISVGSVGLDNKKSDFSNYGSNKLDFVVPGEGLVVAFPNSKRASVNGTSFSAPIAAGAVALALGENPSALETSSIKPLIKGTATNIDLENMSYILKLGGGLLNIEKFLQDMGNSAPSPARTALFVVGNVSLAGSDEFFKERLEQLGFSVSIVKDDNATASQANGKDLVVISSTIDDIGAEFRDVTVPVITWEDGIFDDMSLTWASGDVSNQTSIKIKTSHPLSAGFVKYNHVEVYNNSDSSSENRLAYGKVYAGAIKIATVVNDPLKVVAFAYEKGAALGTIFAPAKRVGLFFQNYEDLPISNYGAAFFDAAVVWATNDRYGVSSTDKTWIEAEAPSSIEGGFIWGSGSAGHVSSAAYMKTSESLGDDYDGNGSPNAQLHYKLKVETSGTYEIWLRGYGEDGTSDSFFVQIDNGAKQEVDYTGVDYHWRWEKVSKFLSAGEHVLTVSLREDGTWLDKILITSDSNYTPSNLGEY